MQYCLIINILNQKKSREESKGADSGVEILVNEPYEGGPGGDGNTGGGQYTRKIYHVGSHLPGNIKNKYVLTSDSHKHCIVCVK